MHQYLLHTNRARTYGSDDGVFGLDDALKVVGGTVAFFALAGVALAIGPHPFSDPFGIKSRKRK